MNFLKQYSNKLSQEPKLKNIISWGKLVSITGFAQIIIQALGFISGILVIRLLPVEEYALYTLANTMLGTMTVLADGGISTGVMAQGGKVWQDREKLGAVLATGLDLRKKFAIGSLIVSTPILIYLLLHNGASWITAFLIALSLIPAFYAGLSDTLLQIVPKLHQSILPLQKNQVAVGVVRLMLTTFTLFIFPWTFIAILGAGIPRAFGNIHLKKIASDLSDTNQLPDPNVRVEILVIVKKVLPGAIYYTISSQITIWLISIFGNTQSIAQLGALGRFSMIYTMIGVFVSTLIVPRFARLSSNYKEIIKSFIQIQIVLFGFSFITVFIFVYFYDIILWLLGDDYKNLRFELILIAISGGVAFISGNTNSLLSSRGIIIPPTIFILIAIAVQIVTATIFPLHEIIGVIQFSIYSVLAIYLVRIGYFIYYIKKYETIN